MAESESIVSILLKVKADKAQLAALQADFVALKETGSASMNGIGSSADALMAHLQGIEQQVVAEFGPGFAVVGAQAAEGLNLVSTAAEATTASVASSGAAVATHAEIMSVWASVIGKTGDSLITMGGATVKLSTLTDSFSAILLQAALAGQGVTQSIQELAATATLASEVFAFQITPAMEAWKIATVEQKVALQELIATDDAAGFASLVQGITSGTAATSALAQSTAAATQTTNAFAQGTAAAAVTAGTLAQGTAAATQTTNAFAQGTAAAVTTTNALAQGTTAATQATGAFTQGTAAAVTATTNLATRTSATAAGIAAVGAATTSSTGTSLQFARSIDQMASGAVRIVPGMGAAAGAIRGLGGGAITAAGQVGILNAVLLGAGIAGVIAFGAAIAGVITKGIELQKQLQELGEGVKGTLASNTDFSKADIKTSGPAAIEAIKNAALDAQVPVGQLAKDFDAIFPAASRANTTIGGLANVIAKLTSVEDALHIPSAKIVTDLQAIFNGSVTNTNQLAQQLSITKEQAVAWREAGTTTDELAAKVKTFADANDSSTESIARGQQKVAAGFDNLAIAGTKDTVQPVTKALNDLAAAENDPAFQTGIANLVSGFAALVSAAMAAYNACVWVGKGIVAVINAMGQFANSLVVKGMNPADNSADVDRLSQQEQLQIEARKRVNDIDLPERKVEGTSTGTRPAVGAGGGGGGGGGGGKGPSQDTQDQKQISEIQSELNAKTEEYHSLIEQNNAAHLLGKTTLAQEKAANLDATNTYITGIDSSIQKLQAMKAAVQAVADAHGGLNVAEQKQLNNLDQMIAKMKLVQSQAEVKNLDNTFWGQWDKGMRSFSDSLILTGAKAQQVFQGIVNQGIDATSQALTGLISGTKDWASAFQQAGQAIIQTLIKVALQAVIGNIAAKLAAKENIITQAYGAAAGTYKDVSQNMPYGWIYAPIFAAIAFAATAAFGSFAEGGIIGGSPSSKDNVLIHAATGEGIVTTRAVQQYGASTIHAMNAGTFVLGGIIPNFTPRFADGGIVGSFGTQGGGGTDSKGVSVNNFWDKDEMVQHMISHPDLSHHIINTIRKNRFQLKI